MDWFILFVHFNIRKMRRRWRLLLTTYNCPSEPKVELNTKVHISMVKANCHKVKHRSLKRGLSENYSVHNIFLLFYVKISVWGYKALTHCSFYRFYMLLFWNVRSFSEPTYISYLFRIISHYHFCSKSPIAVIQNVNTLKTGQKWPVGCCFWEENGCIPGYQLVD